MNYITSLVIFLLFISGAFAQKDISTFENIIDDEKIHKIKFTNENGSFISKEFEGDKVLEITTLKHLDKQYRLATKIPLQVKSIKKNQHVLISFKAKTLDASLETGEAKILLQLNVSEKTKDRIRNVVSIGNEWKEYFIPIEINKYVNKKDLKLVIQYGFPPQKLIVKDISFQIIDASVPFSELPKTLNLYDGMESDATWRQEAFERIEKHRKGDISIRVIRNGEPVENVGLNFVLSKHYFNWGAAVRVNKIANNSAEQERLANTFNLVVLENDLKPKFWGKKNDKNEVLKTITDMRRKGVAVKGHVLVWPGFRHMPPEYRKLESEPSALKNKIDDYMEDVLSKTSGLVDRWDVVNEAYTNKDLQRLTGSEEVLYNAFEKVRDEFPGVKRYVNEYGIISKGGLNSIKQEWYYEYIKRIDENTDGAVDGIGIQSHIGTDLTPPEKVYEILEYYAKLGKTISISEFTMDIREPSIRQLYTEDFMVAAFSHPAVNEFLFWGYRGDETDKVDIFQRNNTLGSMGKAYFSLVHGMWKTDISTVTNSEGEINDRGFYGTYEFFYEINGELRKGKFRHLPGQDTVVNIELP